MIYIMPTTKTQRKRKPSAIASFIDELGIDETFTKPLKKAKQWTKVKTIVPLVEDYNFGADLLMLPMTKKKYRYLLVVVDLANDDFDIEPLTNKDPPAVLDALQAMFKRSYIKKPYASVRTDGGTEFKGEFTEYMYDNSILHKVAQPARHSQNSNAESLNRQLGRILNGYMNKMEKQSGKQYSEWTDILDLVRDKLNKIRHKTLPKDWRTRDYTTFDADPEAAKFKEGDLVHRALDIPKNALNVNQSGSFREGDFRFSTHLQKVKQVLHYPPPVPFRYVLEGMPTVSFTENQLMPPTKKEIEDNEPEKFIVQSIKGKKVINKKIHYQVKWKNYKELTWEPAENMLQDAPELVAAFEEKAKKKKK